jgi:hypothetical protein
MPVTVDDRNLEAEELGLATIGEVLSHLKKERRLVVQVLIDGEEPDLDRLGTVRRRPLAGHTLYIETADPAEMARQVLAAVEEELIEADRLKGEAAELLSSGQNPKAMEKLAGCFGIWQHAQESVEKTGQLLSVELSEIVVKGRPLTELLGQFSEQLRQIKMALENRDFVTLGDILRYETTQTTDDWRCAIAVMVGAVQNQSL